MCERERETEKEREIERERERERERVREMETKRGRLDLCECIVFRRFNLTFAVCHANCMPELVLK